MAQANVLPQVDVRAGSSALDEDIPRVLSTLGVSTIEEMGWNRPSKLTLLVPMRGTIRDHTDSYLLKLGFQAYREWPPSAQFVNPETLNYVPLQDRHHVPKLTHLGCRTHAEYNTPQGTPIQLICCSATLEFYDVQHSVEAHHVWRRTDTFLATLSALWLAFSSSYQGRFERHGQ